MAELASAVNCTASVASADPNNDIKNAPKIKLEKKPNSVGGNNFTGRITGGGKTYTTRISVQQMMGEENILIDYTVQRIGAPKVTAQGGYSKGLKIYYGESEFLVSCDSEEEVKAKTSISPVNDSESGE